MAGFPEKVDRFTEETAWSTDPLPSVAEAFASNVSDDWLAGQEGALSLAHENTRFLLMTATGVSRTLRSELDADDASGHVPMGYTALTLCQKRGVLQDGRPLRVWPRRPRRYGPNAPTNWVAIVPQDEPAGRPLSLGLPSTVAWHAMEAALELSALLPGRPILLAGELGSRGWH